MRRLAPLCALVALASCMHRTSPEGDGARTATPPDGAFPAMLGDGRAHEFAPGSIARGRETMVSLSADGRTVHVMRVTRAPVVRVEIVRSDFVRGRWTEPTPVPLGTGPRTIDPVLAPDGARLYFQMLSPASAKRAEDPAGVPLAALDFDLFVAERGCDTLRTPTRLPDGLNTPQSEFYLSATRRGTLYFTRMSPDYTDPVVLRARPIGGGRYAPPETLTTINDRRSVGNAFIAPDESFLVFSDDRRAGAGRSDLFISLRRGTGWSEPRNLGPAINGPDDEIAPTLSPDGSLLFFTRTVRTSADAAPRYVLMVARLRDVLDRLDRER
jgi:hypothetical protein